MNESGFVRSDLSVFAAALGRLGKGKKKRMSPEAIEQRRKAGIASGFSRALNKNPFWFITILNVYNWSVV
jgi:hypothetical protein